MNIGKINNGNTFSGVKIPPVAKKILDETLVDLNETLTDVGKIAAEARSIGLRKQIENINDNFRKSEEVRIVREEIRQIKQNRLVTTSKETIISIPQYVQSSAKKKGNVFDRFVDKTDEVLIKIEDGSDKLFDKIEDGSEIMEKSLERKMSEYGRKIKESFKRN